MVSWFPVPRRQKLCHRRYSAIVGGVRLGVKPGKEWKKLVLESARGCRPRVEIEDFMQR